MRIVSAPSPHHNARPAGTVVDCVVMHCDASPNAAGTVSWLQSAASKVSYHALVDRDGATLWAFVDTARRAWHAGVSEFLGRKNVNDFSIGVSLANRNDGEPYPPAQLDAAAAYVAGLMKKHPAITLERITTHRVIAPTRKTDPCPPFDLVAFRERVRRALATSATPAGR